MEIHLVDIWLMIIGFLLLVYALTDGFDLGVGIISLTARDGRDRGLMMDSIGGIWHLNQTWLVVLGGMLFGAFPLFYGVLFSALYLPAMVMLLGFIFRGVAFDFREHAAEPGIWEFLFGLGSLITTLAQGLALGGLLSGLRLSQGLFVGSVWGWWNPFSALVALGVFLGYVMLGAHYLILKTEGALQDRSRRLALFSSLATLFVSGAVYLGLIRLYPHMARKWSAVPDFYLVALFPLLAAGAFLMLFLSLLKRKEKAPLFWNAALVLFSFSGVSVSLYPQMIPHVVSPTTVTEVAASPRTLLFMLIVTVILLPLIVLYTSYTYRVFGGKVPGSGGYGGPKGAGPRPDPPAASV
jgi:cytochrome d ubiquinol oxidase subunit II